MDVLVRRMFAASAKQLLIKLGSETAPSISSQAERKIRYLRRAALTNNAHWIYNRIMSIQCKTFIRRGRRPRNKAGNATSSEFVMALFVFFMVLLFPLINLIGLGMGAGTQYLMTKQCASAAGSSTTYRDALLAMEREANLFVNSGFGQFAKLRAVGGYSGTGTDLYVIETNLTGGSRTYGPNTQVTTAIDTANNVYEYQVRSVFDVGPFTNLSAVPWINTVPGVGRPARMTFVAQSLAEFTDGLALGAGGGTTVGPGGMGASLMAPPPPVP